jgi:hypothetical protein
MPAWGHPLLRAAPTGVALIMVVGLTGPGWICYPFLSDRQQGRMLELLDRLVDWVRGSYPSGEPAE